jgi:2-methylaconitate cis-trans-isomerase PrpF
MNLNRIPGKLIRGGTSKGLYIKASDLPSNFSERDSIILRLIGSPDPTGMQLDGIGGGISSTSKVAIVSKISKFSVKDNQYRNYLNYNFGQVSLKESKIDWSGNCGNLASGLFEYIKGEKEFEDCLEKNLNDQYSHSIRVWQENKNHEMTIRGWLTNSNKKCSISGVPHFYEPIFVEFNNLTPEGKSLLPTGRVIEKILINENEYIETTLVAGTNPLVIIRPETLSLKGNEIPCEINYEHIKKRINSILTASAKKMGIEITDSLRLAWVTSPQDYKDSSGNMVTKNSFDILSRITAPNRVHHTHTGTGAINIAAVSLIEGTLASYYIDRTRLGRLSDSKEIRIGHPGGVMTCEAEVEYSGGNWRIKKGGFIRNAKLLMDGYVYF